MSYPLEPGARAHAARTSHDAAAIASKSAPKMLDRVEIAIRSRGPLSCEEITEAIRLPGEHLLLTSVRARVCQLRALGRVKDSGERGLGESLKAKVVRWVRCTDEEIALAAARRAAEAEKGEAANG